MTSAIRLTIDRIRFTGIDLDTERAHSIRDMVQAGLQDALAGDAAWGRVFAGRLDGVRSDAAPVLRFGASDHEIAAAIVHQVTRTLATSGAAPAPITTTTTATAWRPDSGGGSP